MDCFIFKQCTKKLLVCQSDKLIKAASTEVSKGPWTHQVPGTACEICTTGSHLALPYTIACTSPAAGTASWPPSSTHPPHGHRFGTLVYGAGGGRHSATAELPALPAGL